MDNRTTTDLPSPTNSSDQRPLDRAGEVSDLLQAVQQLLIPFIRAADKDAGQKASGHGLASSGGGPRTVLVEYHKPNKLAQLLNFDFPQIGKGKEGLLEAIKSLLQYSVNTWDLGFLDKLYASTNAVGVASELVLAVLNTNVHVYQVSPALTIIEKTVSRQLASLFGFTGSHAGGIAQQGGSASNTTSIVIARNSLYPETKSKGIADKRFILFTSQHGHYSLEKAAQMCGFGSDNVWSVPVNEQGQMIPQKLNELVDKALNAGHQPFYVNATAGTTVLGSYDPFESIAEVCRHHKLWMHVDGSWGGPVIFSEKQKWKLKGVARADSLAMNPHKMMGVPITCSFLLTPDLRKFHKANTLPAGYLFHNDSGQDKEVWDLADLTLQCGRKADSLKLALGWVYYGKEGYERHIDHAFDTAAYMACQISKSSNFLLISESPPPCLQVCFYYAQDKILHPDAATNTASTRKISQKLISDGFMIDFAPGDKGSFFRVVVNSQTQRDTVDGLLKAIEVAGQA